MAKKESKITISGEVYNVKERLQNDGLPCETIDPDWYEYEVYKLNSKGEVIDSWDSGTETYFEGAHQLTQEEAEDSLQKAIRDGGYFD